MYCCSIQLLYHLHYCNILAHSALLPYYSIALIYWPVIYIVTGSLVAMTIIAICLTCTPTCTCTPTSLAPSNSILIGYYANFLRNSLLQLPKPIISLFILYYILPTHTRTHTVDRQTHNQHTYTWKYRAKTQIHTHPYLEGSMVRGNGYTTDTYICLLLGHKDTHTHTYCHMKRQSDVWQATGSVHSIISIWWNLVSYQLGGT